MTEAFLHYVWQFQYFDKNDLRTTAGDQIVIYSPGHYNVNAGPDFHDSRLRIGEVRWGGTVELHIFSSGWTDHRHDDDPAYDNVILHVVWKDDQPIKRRNNTELPTLELHHRVSDDLILQYRKLVNNPDQIPCAGMLNNVRDITVHSMLERTALQRLEEKSNFVLAQLERNNGDWEETGYQVLMRNFGFKLNAEAFERLAKSLPYRVLQKHSDQLLQLEAMLFGQAGFLEGEQATPYEHLLNREYRFLEHKFSLAKTRLSSSQWKFLRLRPANFPTLRIAQAAALLHRERNIFSKIISAETSEEAQSIFAATPSLYWSNHYHFRKESNGHESAIGFESIRNIIVNTVVPLLAAYAKEKDDSNYLDRAIAFLQATPAERNVIIRRWASFGRKAKTAFESQAILELNNNLCLKRRCLDCAIGTALLKPKKL